MTKMWSLKATLRNWKTKEWGWKLVSYPTGGANFPVESDQSWASKEEAEVVCARVNAGDGTGLTFSSYADD